MKKVVLFVVVLCGCGSAGAASDEARKYAQELGLDVRGVSCANRDSDDDGYVSCTISTVDMGLVPVECASRWTMNEGCRVQKALPVVKSR